MALKISSGIRHDMGVAFIADVNNAATIKIYDGVRPATGGGALSGNNLLSTLVCGSPFGTDTSGVITLGAVSNDTNAAHTGSASWFRINTAVAAWVMDGSVTATGGGGDLTLTSIAIVAGATVSLSGTNTITLGNAP